MRWRKLGLVYGPDGSKPWARSHAANPTAEHVEDDLFRIYFSARDVHDRSSIGYVVLDVTRPHDILEVAESPVLSPGPPGAFDDAGASIGCILPVDGARYLYYMGWHLAEDVPWRNALGLAISPAPGEPFARHAEAPVMPLDDTDPHTISYPWVLHESGLFRMWYGSNLQWGPTKEHMRHVIKYAESDDGIRWRRSGRVAVGLELPGEYAICRPCVRPAAGGYEMWFCSRGERYRIRRACSDDGLEWRRVDAGIDVSDEGWDAGMIEYPFVFTHRGCRYLLYCGDDYGRSGFGIAVQEGS